jgi:hypothetical protein
MLNVLVLNRCLSVQVVRDAALPLQYGKSWTVSEGKLYNGVGAAIEKPAAYFSAVADNKYGYNTSYTTGAGVAVEKPSAYYAAVGACA